MPNASWTRVFHFIRAFSVSPVTSPVTSTVAATAVSAVISMIVPQLALGQSTFRQPASYQIERDTVVGRKAATRYFTAQSGDSQDGSEGRLPQSENRHQFSIGAGSFLNSRAYQWLSSSSEDSVGRMVYGFAYDFGEWNQFDFTLRVQYQEFEVRGIRISKLSFQPSLSLPQAGHRLPFYFGVGLGGGLFFNQPAAESPVSLDYKLFAGLRVIDLFDRTGFYVEWSLENHLHVFSDGQQVGQTLMAGLTFSL